MNKGIEKRYSRETRAINRNRVRYDTEVGTDGIFKISLTNI